MIMPSAAQKAVAQNGVGFAKDHADRVRIDLLDRDVLVDAGGHGRGGGIARVLPGEDAVVGGERLRRRAR